MTALRVALFFCCAFLGTAVAAEHERVILLHGLVRTDRSMEPLAEALEAAGYAVTNLSYPSRSAPIGQLSEEAIGPVLAECRRANATRIHFVAHSLGGILVRSYLSRHAIPELGRVVMLGPPNQGSEVVDQLGAWPVFGWLNGPAGRELCTAPDSTPNRLGPAGACVGVIAGDRSINWINSLMIAGPDDGKVSVERTKLPGMADHLVVHATHPFIMRNQTVIAQTIHFLREGQFLRPDHADETAP